MVQIRDPHKPIQMIILVRDAPQIENEMLETNEIGSYVRLGFELNSIGFLNAISCLRIKAFIFVV